MNLSRHFTLDEFTLSQTAARLDLDNTPDPDALARLKTTAAGMEEVRAYLGKPINISSGYRSPAVNAAVGSGPTSAHVKGMACDFTAPAFGTPLAICRALLKSGIEWDQLLFEHTWVHLSFDPRMRQQTKTLKGGNIFFDGLPKS